MKKLLIFLAVVLAACGGQVNKEQHDHETVKEQEQSGGSPSLNNGRKWKADEATRKNAAEMAQVVNDRAYADAAKRMQLYAALQTKIDTMVKQCTMQGPEHDALHVWLTGVLGDMKELKEEAGEYNEVRADLKKDIEQFNTLFE